VLAAQWLSSLDSPDPVLLNVTHSTAFENEELIPFTLGERFGYVNNNGNFIINQVKQGNLSLSETKWAVYGAQVSEVQVYNNHYEIIETINNPLGYPVFFDDQTYIINSEQNAFSKVGHNGSVLWTYEFPAPLTCADAAAGLLLAGTVDGSIEVISAAGKQLFSFQPGGSRYSVILGCAFSHDGTRFAVLSGIDKQRFLLFERFGSTGTEYKIIYHEFLEEGFRRPVHILFIDRDRKVVFERETGLGIYDINSRKSYLIPLEGRVLAVDNIGDSGRLFAVTGTTLSETKNLIGINLPDRIFITAPFRSIDVFLSRSDSLLYVGGSNILAAFALEKK